MTESVSGVSRKKLTLDSLSKTKLGEKLGANSSVSFQNLRSNSGKTITTIEVRKSKRQGNFSSDGQVTSNINSSEDPDALTMQEQQSRLNALQNSKIGMPEESDTPVREIVDDVDSNHLNEDKAQYNDLVSDDSKIVLQNPNNEAEDNPIQKIKVKEALHVKEDDRKLKKYEKDYDEKKAVIKKGIDQEIYNKHVKLAIEEALVGDEKPLRRFSHNRLRKNRNPQSKRRDKLFRNVVIPDKITVQELSNRMSERGRDVMQALAKLGKHLNLDDFIDGDTACDIVSSFNHTFKRVMSSQIESDLFDSDDNFELKLRPPVVTVMGHVDHGKTSLLDAMRKANIAGREFGGITQHIGAYQVTASQGDKITFIDTPGHEAFTAMRARGANVTDIVVLVVAADDGIMMQTIEAINHAKAANVPVIVAVNKIDKPGTDVNRVINSLLQHDIIPESLGGDVIVVPVSAKEKINLDKLEESILLIAEMLELKASPECRASGVVIESRVDKNRGILATFIVQKGTLKVGDMVVAGNVSGKVRAMFDDVGKKQTSALPSVPVEILGLSSVPNAGDTFVVVDSEKQSKDLIDYRAKLQQLKLEGVDPLYAYNGIDSTVKIEELNIILKCDVTGSVEAIYDSLGKLEHEELKLNVLHRAVGNVTDSDVMLAEASGTIILAFNVKVDAKIKDLAKQKGIDIRSYSIIYELIDDVRDLLNGMLKPLVQEVKVGSLSVRQVFASGKNGTVIGCYVTEGIIKRGSLIKLYRNGEVIYQGKLKVLRRFKDDVKEVKSGFECGILLDYHKEIRIGDVIEAFDLVEEIRTIK